MFIPPEILNELENLKKRAKALLTFVDVSKKQAQIAELEQKMANLNFWDNPKSAKVVIEECNLLKNAISPVLNFNNELNDFSGFCELVQAENDDPALLNEIETGVKNFSKKIETLEIASFLSGTHDHCNAIFSIHAGAGGTESCDWADMLLRMYLRWTERRGFNVEIQDMQQGEEAGISRVTFRIIGPNAYGYAKAERGVHRLVRISPFDSNKRRHTSFCAIDVIAEVEDDVDIEIKDDDLRVDTYRSSGKGGQHVNKTESAVRLTHLPTGIVVTCQNERSQIKNRETAMKTLRSRIFERMQDEKRSEMEKFYGEKGEIGWGNQIRSYVFQPYQMVKDLRTGAESGNLQAIMDGDIDLFINAWLRAGGPKTRNQSIQSD